MRNGQKYNFYVLLTTRLNLLINLASNDKISIKSSSITKLKAQVSTASYDLYETLSVIFGLLYNLASDSIFPIKSFTYTLA